MTDRRRRPWFPILIAALIVLACAAYVLLGADTWLLEAMQKRLTQANAYYEAHSLRVALIFFLIFTAVNALMVPGSLPLMLLAGAVFGVTLGLTLCVLAGTLGSCIAFLLARHLFFAAVQRRYQRWWRMVDNQLRQHGVFYLIVLRIAPGIPTNVISLAMGVSSVRFVQFFWVTLFGIIPWYAVYVMAGQQLGEMQRFSDIVSKEMLGMFSFAVLVLIVAFILKQKFLVQEKGQLPGTG